MTRLILILPCIQLMLEMFVSVTISLLVCKVVFSVMIDVPKFHHKILNIIIPRIWEKGLVWKGEHYWEVGIRGLGKRKILDIMERYFQVKRHYIVPENTFHWFVIADVKNGAQLPD